MVLADVKLADGPTSGELTLGSTRDVIGFLAPYDRGDEDGAWYRAMVWDRKHQVPDTEPASPDEVIDVLTRAMGRDRRRARDRLVVAVSTATNARSPNTVTAACFSPATPHTCIRRWAGRV